MNIFFVVSATGGARYGVSGFGGSGGLGPTGGDGDDGSSCSSAVRAETFSNNLRPKFDLVINRRMKHFRVKSTHNYLHDQNVVLTSIFKSLHKLLKKFVTQIIGYYFIFHSPRII